ncbi:hypothetical protein Bca101_096108 [Brassica carinata]
MELELCETGLLGISYCGRSISHQDTLILVGGAHLEASSMVCRDSSSITHLSRPSHLLAARSRQTPHYRRLEIKKDIVKLHQRFMSSLCDLVSSYHCRVKWRQ